MSDTSSSDYEDVLNVYTDVSDDDDDGDTYSRGSTSELEIRLDRLERGEIENVWRELEDKQDHHAPSPWPPIVQVKPKGDHEKQENPGVLYLTSVPPGFNVSRTIVFFSKFGKVGRVFLRPDKRVSPEKRSFFTEGWVEFIKKEDAQEVAKNLHNSKVEGYHPSEPKEVFWSVKYLPEFLWLNLWEKLSVSRDQSCPKPSLESCEVGDETSHTSRKRKRNSATNHIFDVAKQYDFRQKEPETDVVRVSKSRRCKLAAPEQKQASSSNKKSKKKKKARKNKKRKQEKLVTDQGAHLNSRGIDDKPPPSKRARNRSSERREGITVRH